MGLMTFCNNFDSKEKIGVEETIICVDSVFDAYYTRVLALNGSIENGLCLRNNIDNIITR